MRFHMRICGIVGAFCALTACAEIVGVTTTAKPQASLRLLDGTIVASGPSGYCVEPQASRPADGFAVLAACDAIAGLATRPALNGLATLQIGDAGTGLSGGDADALATALRTSSGRALLSRSGTAEDIRVLGAATTSGALTVHFADAAAPPVPGLQGIEWRGFFTVNGRLATVAVRGPTYAPLGTDDGQALLENVIKAVQASNATAQSASDS